MKHLNFLALAFALLAVSCRPAEEKEAEAVIRRTFGQVPARVTFRYTEQPADRPDAYTLTVENGKLIVSGTSAVALCKGFHDYIQDRGYGCVTWSGSRLDLPPSLPEMERTTTVSPYERHLFYNVCTFGYTTAFWGWEEWEKEIDWLALHGFDMPLAPVATEAILARVYTKMGLSWEEISEYFSGPAHFPWMRMGNMCSMDGGMSPEWHESQIALQHKILDRMRALGMEPVFQGFAGFVPEAVEKHFPGVKLTRADWHGLHNQLLSSTDSLFQTIGSAFIREWEAEFGKGKYYLVDSFNEMDVPFGERGTPERYETIKGYASATYRSISSANPDAIWVMQGWMFGRDRKRIWDPQSVKALLDGAPDDKLMIVDLAVDFNEFVWCSDKDWDYLDGFSGKEWIWSTTPNFGGRTMLKGVYDFYLNAHLDALASANKGRLTGYGCSPEGTELNEALFEAVSSAGWRDRPVEARDFLARYFASRYGCGKEDTERLSDGLLGSVYGNFTNMDNFDWMSRPVRMTRNVFHVNEHWYDAVRALLELSDACGGTETYVNDVVYFTAAAVAAKADELYRQIRVLLAAGRFAEAEPLEHTLISILADADKLLESHPLMRMQRWLDMADRMATHEGERLEFRREALRLVTTWDADGIHDYASRIWSGLIRDYYIPRLTAFFEAAHKKEPFDPYALENRFIETAATRGLSDPSAFDDPVEAAKQIFAADVEGIHADACADVAGVYMPATLDHGKVTLFINKEDMEGFSGFVFCDMSGGAVEIKSMKVGNIRVSYPDGARARIPASGGLYRYDGGFDPARVEKQTAFVMTLQASSDASGVIRILRNDPAGKER